MSQREQLNLLESENIAENRETTDDSVISPMQMSPQEQLDRPPLGQQRLPLDHLRMPSEDAYADEEEDIVRYNDGDRGVLSPAPNSIGGGTAPSDRSSNSNLPGMSFYSTGPETPVFSPGVAAFAQRAAAERNLTMNSLGSNTTNSTNSGSGAGLGMGVGVAAAGVGAPLSPTRRASIVNPEVEQRMNAMRERFRMLQVMEDFEPKGSFDNDDAELQSAKFPPPLQLSPAGSVLSVGTPMSANSSSNALNRWNKLRKVVNSKAHFVNWNERQLPILAHSSFKRGRQDSMSSAKAGARRSFDGDADSSAVPIELEDVQLNEYWASIDERIGTTPNATAPPAADVGSVSTGGGKETAEEGSADGLAPPAFEFPGDTPEMFAEEKFIDDVQPVQLTVNRIPEEVVNERKARIEQEIRARQQEAIDRLHKKESDVIAREESARVRLEQQEKVQRRRLDLQKGRIAVLALDKERALAKEFKRTRETLEAGIKRQQAAVKERFGSMLIHEETLARRFQASSIMSPQPIEFRIHMMRAVKTKLPKGAYVLMLTQYDSLGGRPLSWSQIGSNGIGNMRPGITRICKHYGRYFDRVLRVEDSVFALCPPQPLRKPNYVFVLELFQLESRTNPVDRIVGWTALPMCYESMTLIEGKIKLPMMHGEHSPEIELFRTMEQQIAADLSHWLCNIYIEVRHMSLQELGATEDMLRTADFDLDYFNKSMIPLSAEAATAAAEEKESPDLEMGQMTNGSIDGATADAGGKKTGWTGKASISESNPRPPLLPVDKGIFRRKLRNGAGMSNSESAAAAAALTGGGDTSGAGTSVAAASVVTALDGAAVSERGKGRGLSIKANDSDEEPDEDQGLLKPPISSSVRAKSYFFQEDNTGGTIGNQYKNSGAFSKLLFGMGGGASKRSLLSGVSNISRTADRSKPLVLKNDNNFLQHRLELVRRFKANIHAKMDAAGEHDDEIFDEVRERGYNIADESYLHDQQRGKLTGVESIENPDHRHWAQASLEGKIVRKWQAEGPRFDSEAIMDEKLAASPRSKQDPGKHFSFGDTDDAAAAAATTGASAAAIDRQVHQQHAVSIHTGWEELRDVREMEDYSMSIASDPTRRKRLLPGAKARSKLRYIIYEMFGNFTYRLWGTLEFYVSLLVYVFALWIRIYVHYIGQYLFLESLNTPVFDFEMRALEIQQKYMSLSISVAREVGVVAIGPIGNLFVFASLIGAAALSYKYAGFVPDAISILFIAYGFATILDPVLVIVIDLIYHNYDCENKNDQCEKDYTSNKCDCFNGDFVKLWYRMQDEEGSGLTGIFITTLLYMGTGICGLLLLYWYVVHLHRNGKVLDTWRRINAPPEEFFLPLDFEVTSDEVRDVINRARMWRGPNGTRRVLDWHSVEYPGGLGKKYIIFEVEKSGRRSVYRQFVMEPSGLILELFEDAKLSNAPKHAFDTFEPDEEGRPFPPTATAGVVTDDIEDEEAVLKAKLREGATLALPPIGASRVLPEPGKDLMHFDDSPSNRLAIGSVKMKPSPRGGFAAAEAAVGAEADDMDQQTFNTAPKLKPDSRQGSDSSGAMKLRKSAAVAAGSEGAERADGYETPPRDPGDGIAAAAAATGVVKDVHGVEPEQYEIAVLSLAAKAAQEDAEIFI